MGPASLGFTGEPRGITSRMLLAASPTTTSTDVIAWLITALVLVIAGATVALLREWKLRQALREALRAERAKPPQQVLVQSRPEPDRDDLQRRMGELHLAKLQAELELLNRQVAHRDLESDRMAAGKEFHELMVEKAKLEIDSLRLHIAEQRRRMEDWRSDAEE